MVEGLISLLDSGIDFDKVGIYVGIYLILLWFFFSLWVFFDARKRYANPFIAGAFFITVLILNFPMMILYLIIRPELEDHVYFDHDHMNSALNVPILNFVSEKGVEMSLNLKINGSIINPNLADESLKINVNVDGNKESVKLPEKKEVEEEKKNDSKERKSPVKAISNFYKKGYSSTVVSVQGLKSKIFKKKVKTDSEEKKDEDSEATEAPSSVANTNTLTTNS